MACRLSARGQRAAGRVRNVPAGLGAFLVAGRLASLRFEDDERG